MLDLRDIGAWISVTSLPPAARGRVTYSRDEFGWRIRSLVNATRTARHIVFKSVLVHLTTLLYCLLYVHRGTANVMIAFTLLPAERKLFKRQLTRDNNYSCSSFLIIGWRTPISCRNLKYLYVSLSTIFRITSCSVTRKEQTSIT